LGNDHWGTPWWGYSFNNTNCNPLLENKNCYAFLKGTNVCGNNASEYVALNTGEIFHEDDMVTLTGPGIVFVSTGICRTPGATNLQVQFICM